MDQAAAEFNDAPARSLRALDLPIDGAKKIQQ
jgi:hypothetical protein